MTKLQRAYLLGYRRGLNKAQARMRCRVDQWEAEFVAFQDDYETLLNEMRCARDEQAVQEAVSERAMYPNAFLN